MLSRHCLKFYISIILGVCTTLVWFDRVYSAVSTTNDDTTVWLCNLLLLRRLLRGFTDHEENPANSRALMSAVRQGRPPRPPESQASLFPAKRKILTTAFGAKPEIVSKTNGMHWRRMKLRATLVLIQAALIECFTGQGTGLLPAAKRGSVCVNSQLPQTPPPLRPIAKKRASIMARLSRVESVSYEIILPDGRQVRRWWSCGGSGPKTHTQSVTLNATKHFRRHARHRWQRRHFYSTAMGHLWTLCPCGQKIGDSHALNSSWNLRYFSFCPSWARKAQPGGASHTGTCAELFMRWCPWQLSSWPWCMRIQLPTLELQDKVVCNNSWRARSEIFYSSMPESHWRRRSGCSAKARIGQLILGSFLKRKLDM